MADARAFTLDDQVAFAALSGDWNPLHVDPVAARRLLFGEPVVHGVHTVCWALEAATRNGLATACAKRVQALFLNPVLLGRPVALALTTEGGKAKATVVSDDRVCSEIVVEFGPRLAAFHDVAPPDFARIPDKKSLDALTNETGQLRLQLDRVQADAAFPHLLAAWGPGRVATLLATTRLVGMRCPGLHSLYSGLDLSWGPIGDAGGTLSYTVTRAHRLTRLVTMSVEGPGVRGTISSLVRPGIEPQPVPSDLAIEPGLFRPLKALVVGGSRGLGEVAAKLLGRGGADVTITYAAGQADAEAVAADIRNAGGVARTIAFDVTQPPSTLRETLAGLGPFNAVLYFAAPKIVANAGDPTAQRATLYRTAFVAGFQSTLDAALDRDADTRAVFYPSTIFIDDNTAGFEEYVAAKREAEAVCGDLAAADPNLLMACPRLPRARTEQNAGLLSRALAEPVDLLLPWLQLLASDAKGFVSKLEG